MFMFLRFLCFALSVKPFSFKDVLCARVGFPTFRGFVGDCVLWPPAEQILGKLRQSLKKRSCSDGRASQSYA